jgi:hypothetical protein
MKPETFKGYSWGRDGETILVYTTMMIMIVEQNIELWDGQRL